MSGHGQIADERLSAGALEFERLDEMLVSKDAELAAMRRALAAQDVELDEARGALRDAESRFRNIWSATPLGLALANERGELVSVNHALCQLLGRGESELIGSTGAHFDHPEDVPTDGELIGEVPVRGAHVEKRFMRPSGEIRWAWLTMSDVRGPANEAWTLACVDDVTERRTAARRLQDSERNLRAVGSVARRIQAGEDARSTLVDAVRSMVSAHSALLIEPLDDDALVVTACSGVSLDGVRVPLRPGSAAGQVLSTGQSLFLANPVESPLVTRTSIDSEFGSMMWHPVFRDGSCVAVIVVTWPFRIERVPERSERALALLADETSVALSQDELRAELRLMARTDALTQLPNRRAWDTQLAAVRDVAHVTGEPLVIAMVDLDHFKRFNDRHGHAAGDDHLREFGVRARATIRDSDLLVRWGGEEFSMALPNCAPASAHASLTRVLHAVPGNETCSIGWATWNGLETPGELLARVDQALYDAKAAGRNCIVSADLA